jgi:hypothetical protein
MAIPMLNERKVNTAFAIVAIVPSVVAGLAGIVGTAHMLEGMVEGFFSDYEFGYGQMFGGMVAAIFAGIFGILAAVFTLIVLNQWSSALTDNIQNTKTLLTYLKQKGDSEKQTNLVVLEGHLSGLQLYTWAYWVYLIFYVLALFTGVASFVFSILAIIFLAVYLQSVFTVSKRLEEIKNIMYPLLGVETPMLTYIKSRNIGVFILLVIVTLGIYWWYLLIKLSSEINQYIDADQRLRQVINV